MRSKLLIAIPALCYGMSAYGEPFIESELVTRSPHYNGQTGHASVRYRSLFEWMEGRRTNGTLEDQTIMMQNFLIDDTDLLSHLYDVANTLLQQWPGTAPDMAIYVNTGSSYNALTTRSNEIILNIGVLQKATFDDELAALLAHEISHVLLEHNRSADYLTTAQTLINNLARAKMIVKTVEAIDVERENEEVTLVIDPGFMRGIYTASIQQEIATKAYAAVHSTIFTRPQEFEADLLAVDLLTRAGYSSVQGLTLALNQSDYYFTRDKALQAELEESSESLLTGYAADLLAHIESDVAGNWFVPGGLSRELIVDNLKDVALQKVMEQFFGQFNERHPERDARVLRISEYGIEGNVPVPVMVMNASRTDLDAYKSRFEVAAILRDGIHPVNALSQIAFAYVGGSSFSEPLSYEPADSSPFARYTSYRVYLANGDRDQAASAIESLTYSAGIPNHALVDIVNFHVQRLNFAKASELIAARELNGAVAEFYPAKIQIALSEERTDDALGLTTECAGLPEEDVVIKDTCVALTAHLIPRETDQADEEDPITTIFSGFNKLKDAVTQ